MTSMPRRRRLASHACATYSGRPLIRLGPLSLRTWPNLVARTTAPQRPRSAWASNSSLWPQPYMSEESMKLMPRVDSDMSVTGWYVMAFQSGLMAGLEVQSPNLDSISKFLDRVSVENGTQYCYKIGDKPSLTMTAEALLCRQYLGWKHDDPRMRAGIDQLLANRIDYDDERNVYYWYYATQACHHMDGDDWNRWHERLRTPVPAAHTKTKS